MGTEYERLGTQYEIKVVIVFEIDDLEDDDDARRVGQSLIADFVSDDVHADVEIRNLDETTPTPWRSAPIHKGAH